MGEPGTPDLVKLEDLEAVERAHRAQAHPHRSWSRTSRASWPASPASSAAAASTSTRSRWARRRTRTISRVTLTLDGAVHPIDQVTKQLHKLVNVIKIRDMEPDGTDRPRDGALPRERGGREPRRDHAVRRDLQRATSSTSRAGPSRSRSPARRTRSTPSSAWSARTA